MKELGSMTNWLNAKHLETDINQSKGLLLASIYSNLWLANFERYLGT